MTVDTHIITKFKNQILNQFQWNEEQLSLGMEGKVIRIEIASFQVSAIAINLLVEQWSADFDFLEFETNFEQNFINSFCEKHRAKLEQCIAEAKTIGATSFEYLDKLCFFEENKGYIVLDKPNPICLSIDQILTAIAWCIYENTPIPVMPTKTNSVNTNTAETIEIVQYSDKAIAVFGNTRAVKDQLKAIGGRFNRFLKYQDTKTCGWVFSNKKLPEVKKIINQF